MRKSTMLGVVLTSLVMIGCADVHLPTSPSATLGAAGTSVGTGSTQASLRWDLTASGCTPRRPAPQQTASPTHQRELTDGETYYRPGAVLAEWMRDGGDTVWAVFYPESNAHALCLWDTAGL
jgi:hypothetical protein